jgi:hypothetical protein
MSLLLCNFDLGGSASYKRGTVFRLTVTNLHDESLRFLVEFHHRPKVQLANVTGEPPAIRYRTVTKALSVHTGYRADPDVVTGWSLGLDPSETRDLSVQAVDDHESVSITKAGHVVLRLPTGSALRSGYRLAPQAAMPVPVLVSATRLDYRSSYQAGIVEPTGIIPYHMSAPDDLATSEVPLSTGKAHNDVDPEGLIVGSIDDIRDLITVVEGHQLESAGRRVAETGIELWEPQRRVVALLQLLDGLDPSREEVDAINEVLSDHGTRVKLT